MRSENLQPYKKCKVFVSPEGYVVQLEKVRVPRRGRAKATTPGAAYLYYRVQNFPGKYEHL